MERVKCPYCGAFTEGVNCPKCFAEVPREKTTEENKTARKGKTNKEVKNHG